MKSRTGNCSALASRLFQTPTPGILSPRALMVEPCSAFSLTTRRAHSCRFGRNAAGLSVFSVSHARSSTCRARIYAPSSASLPQRHPLPTSSSPSRITFATRWSPSFATAVTTLGNWA